MANGRGNPKGYSDPRGAHIRIYHEVFDSNAWRCLPATAKLAYLAIHRQLKSTNNGDLSLPLSTARQAGITSPATLAKALRALVAVGLLAVSRRGGCDKDGHRLPTLYRLTDFEGYASPTKHIEASKATNEWRLISTLGQGRESMRRAEAEAKKTQLQKLAYTASKNEVWPPSFASKNEVWTPSPTSKIEAGEKPKKGCKPNAGAGFTKKANSAFCENHTSKNEALSTVAIPAPFLGCTGDHGRYMRLTTFKPGQFINLIH